MFTALVLSDNSVCQKYLIQDALMLVNLCISCHNSNLTFVYLLVLMKEGKQMWNLLLTKYSEFVIMS